MKQTSKTIDNQNTEVGIRLRHLRKEKHLTQKEFAKIGNVSIQSQRFYESGERSPNTEYLQYFVTYGIDVCYLFSGLDRTEEPRQETTINQDILSEILEVMESTLTGKRKTIDNKVKADLISLFYVSFSELGKVNPMIIKGHLAHIN